MTGKLKWLHHVVAYLESVQAYIVQTHIKLRVELQSDIMTENENYTLPCNEVKKHYAPASFISSSCRQVSFLFVLFCLFP